MADPSPLLAGRDPADVLSVFGEGSGKGRKTQRGVESAVSLERDRSVVDSVNESLVKGLEGDRHPLERAGAQQGGGKRFVMGTSTCLTAAS